MSNKKNKIYQGFRLDPDVIERLKELVEKDPVVFSSYARLVDAALFHFLTLNKTEQKEAIGDYLTKHL
jgi:hypothetical protein